MSEPALKDDVIAALQDAPGVDVTALPNGSHEISAVDQPIRTYTFKATVPRNLLWRFVSWYNIPMGAFFKSRVAKRPDAVGE